MDADVSLYQSGETKLRTVLVTGARGFIGVAMVEHLLKQNVHVRCLLRNKDEPGDLRSLDVECVEGNIRNYQSMVPAVEGSDVVIHLAGLVSALKPQEMMRTNRCGTANVAKACAMASSNPIHVLVSSIAASGAAERGGVRTENDPPAPVSIYGRSKLAGEKAAAKWSSIVPTTIVRPGIVFGERNREMLPMFYSIDRFHLHPHPNLHSMPLSVIYVHDLAELIWQAALRGERIQPAATTKEERAKGIYFACAEEHPSYANFGRLVGSALDREPVIVVPLIRPLPWIVGTVNEWISRVRNKSHSLNSDKIREASVSSWACSPERARTVLGFDTHRPLLNQLRETANWYREHRWL